MKANAQSWELVVGGQEQGPYSTEQVIEAIERGLARTTPVRRAGTERWASIESIPQFEDVRPSVGSSGRGAAAFLALLGMSAPVRRWYVSQSEVVQGPLEAQEVRAWITDGRLVGSDSVRLDGATLWVPLEESLEFRAAWAAHHGSEEATRVAAPRDLAGPADNMRDSHADAGPLVTGPRIDATHGAEEPESARSRTRGVGVVPVPSSAIEAASVRDRRDERALPPRWYVANGSEADGPFDLAELRASIARGTLRPHHSLCAMGTQQWVPARTLTALADLFPPPAPPAEALATPKPAQEVPQSRSTSSQRSAEPAKDEPDRPVLAEGAPGLKMPRAAPVQAPAAPEVGKPVGAAKRAPLTMPRSPPVVAQSWAANAAVAAGPGAQATVPLQPPSNDANPLTDAEAPDAEEPDAAFLTPSQQMGRRIQRLMGGLASRVRETGSNPRGAVKVFAVLGATLLAGGLVFGAVQYARAVHAQEQRDHYNRLRCDADALEHPQDRRLLEGCRWLTDAGVGSASRPTESASAAEAPSLEVARVASMPSSSVSWASYPTLAAMRAALLPRLDPFWQQSSVEWIDTTCPAPLWPLFRGHTPGQDEFERRANESQRVALRTALAARTFASSVDGREVTFGTYDFVRHELPITLTSQRGANECSSSEVELFREGTGDVWFPTVTIAFSDRPVLRPTTLQNFQIQATCPDFALTPNVPLYVSVWKSPVQLRVPLDEGDAQQVRAEIARDPAAVHALYAFHLQGGQPARTRTAVVWDHLRNEVYCARHVVPAPVLSVQRIAVAIVVGARVLLQQIPAAPSGTEGSGAGIAGARPPARPRPTRTQPSYFDE